MCVGVSFLDDLLSNIMPAIKHTVYLFTRMNINTQCKPMQSISFPFKLHFLHFELHISDSVKILKSCEMQFRVRVKFLEVVGWPNRSNLLNDMDHCPLRFTVLNLYLENSWKLCFSTNSSRTFFNMTTHFKPLWGVKTGFEVWKNMNNALRRL